MRNEVTISKDHMIMVCDMISKTLVDCALTCMGDDEFGEMATHFTKTTAATYARVLIEFLFNNEEGE